MRGRRRWSSRKRFGSFLLGAVALGLALVIVQTDPGAHARADESDGVPSADLIIVGGKVWTGADRQWRGAKATALAIVGDTIVAVGRDDDVRRRIGPKTKIIDAGGKRIIPGITDSHTHVVGGGLQLQRLYLRDVSSRSQFIRAVADAAKTKKKGEWVLGGRWSVESWHEPQSPRATWMDPVTGDTPVFLSRMDGHSAVVNTVALRLAGIDALGPPDPEGGEIERDPATSEPTGILKESAQGLVRRLIPVPSSAQRYAALLRAMKHANSFGVTSVHDMCGFDDLATFLRARDAGTLTVRITAYIQAERESTPSDYWSGRLREAARTRLGLDGKMVRVAGFKGYVDGSLGSRTAYMREPFSDATSEMRYPRGQLSAFAASHDSFVSQIVEADALGLQLALHAIGDEANHLALNAYEEVRKRNGRRDALHRVEHAQHLHVSDIPRFATLGVVASMQPFHKADDGRYAEVGIGKARLEGSYAYRQLVDSGAPLIFGSDWPVVTLNPFAGMDAAVNARTLAGDVWLASHSLTVEEALRAYTVLPPRAVHRGSQLGTLEVGKLADLVILSDDPLTIDKDRLGQIKVATTIVAGRVVYDAMD